MSKSRVSPRLCVAVVFLLWVQTVAAAPPLDTNETTAENAFNKGRHAQAIVHYQRLLRKQSGNSGYRARLAESYEISGNLALAEEHAAEVLRDQSRNIDALMTMGRVRGRQGDWASAKAFYGRAIRANKNDATAHLSLGQALTQLGKQDEAEAEFAEYRRLTGTTQP